MLYPNRPKSKGFPLKRSIAGDTTLVRVTDQTAFICRGKAAIARSMAAGHWIPADEVLAKLEAKVETARLRRFQN